MMGNTRNDNGVGLIGRLFGMFFGSQFGSALKYGMYASVTGSLGVLAGIAAWVVKDFKTGALTFVAFAFIALILAVVAANKQRKALGLGKSKRSTGSGDSLFDEVDEAFRRLQDDDFPPLFGTTPRRPARSTTPHPASSSHSSNAAAFTDVSASGADSMSFHKHSSDDNVPRHDGHTIHQDSSGHSSSPSGSSGTTDTGSASSDGGSTSV